MDLNTQGWLRSFCEKVETKSNLEGLNLSEYEHAVYKLIQPSGIMYGHPVKEIGRAGIINDQLDPVDKMKLIFAESLIRTGSLRLAENVSVKPGQVADQLIPEISEYFLNLYPEMYHGSATSYMKRPYYMAEKLIGQRITIKTSLVKNYLASLFHNSLLFIDVVLFGEWVSGMGSLSTAELRNESARFRLSVLSVMALAASADRKLQHEERALFEFYLESAGLNHDMKLQARALLKGFGKLSEIDVQHIESWLVRKYLLEMAILVTLADREINEKEHEFIIELGGKLGFSDEEISGSLMAVESFVIDNWSAMHYLLGTSSLEMISHRFIVRLKGFVSRNKDHVVQEIRESKELFYLLGKSRTKTLTDEEKKIVNEQLMDIIKTIPTFVIIALPFTFITLPTLLAILPKKAFPSSFQE